MAESEERESEREDAKLQKEESERAEKQEWDVTERTGKG